MSHSRSLYRSICSFLSLTAIFFSNILSADWSPEPDVLSAPTCGWGYLPQYYGNCDFSDGIFDRLLFRADFLYWKPTEDGLDLGSEESLDVVVDDGDVLDIFDCSSQSKLDFDYTPSFRIGFMFLLPCDGWDATINWTYFRSKANAHACGFLPDDFPDTTDSVTFISDWERFSNLVAGCARSRWNLNLNLIDLELGRTFFVSPNMVMRPHMGLRFASIDQTYQVNSLSEDPFDDLLGFESFSKSVSKFSGIGVRTGLDLDYKLIWGFSVFGQVAVSLIYGEVESSSKEFAEATFLDDEDEILGLNEYHAKNNYRRTRTALDMAIGVKWDDAFNLCGKFHPIGFAVLWEHHAFYRMNDFEFDKIDIENLPLVQKTGSHYKDGDLTTSGLTLSFFVGF